MTTNTIKDLATLTTIPEKTLHKMFKKMVYCICETLQENILEDKSITSLDVGIGTLYIKHETSENLKYHFEPSSYLEKSLKDTILNKQNLLEDVLNESLNEKFMEVYKNLC